MKNLFFTIFVSILVLSCDGFSPFEEQVETAQSSTSSSYSAETAEKTDSISQKVDSVKASVSQVVEDIKLHGDQILDLQTDVKDTKQNIEKLQKEKLDMRQIFIVSAIILLLCIVILFIVAKKATLSKDDIKNIVDKKYRKLLSESTSNNSSDIKLRRLEDENRRLHQEVTDLKNRFSNLQYTLQNNRGATNQTGSNPPSQHPPKTEQHLVTSMSKFYMPEPQIDGDFLDSQKSSIQKEDHFYEFEVDKKNPRKAKFEFKPYNKNRQSYAHDYSPQVIEPACELIDGGTSDFTSTRGEAELKEGKWHVTKKPTVIFR